MDDPVCLCRYCQVGYHAPFGRFERVATLPDGPTFLNRCTLCGALWQEGLHSATLLTRAQAAERFPGLPSDLA